MKTSELSGTFLDYWVAKAEGYEPWAGATMPKGEFMWKAPRAISPSVGWLSHKFSRDWALAGPIIERERLAIAPAASGGWASWPWKGDESHEARFEVTGPTPLIAAMRAYVASKFGEEVLDGKDIRNE